MHHKGYRMIGQED